MASGQTPGPQGPYPAYQPVYQPPRKPLSDYVKMLLSDIILAALLFIGLLFLWLGQLLAGTMDDPDVGNGLWSFGMLFATWALIIGGVLRHDLEKWVRFAMIAAGTLLIIVVGFWPHSLLSISIPGYV